ncbi:MAG: Chromosome partition protein smc [uncultured Aureispira sp.]|uniref:Chromosome partition protein Smc n=1 Tax=uncultured Aureispira sp. TaxID=1331704 RepID=A0A6S6SUA3_9BACT|nr:MAG: Chromosome partition protein smc [uncultured Aureispira sp.]
MRLKSLDIKGFKSFADRTVINFGEDVIGIVGSNGCGKSNIVDSIRWVLGEQKTSQLRSESMTSVIFNGTKGRKASGLAEVSLTFTNDKGILPLEYQEVTIKRILYKDGSSEYQLNGIKCRLKDISNLLVDTGMGSDSYAIIALGMVDDLLQDKDNSRLKLFEQAAGISKYKSRKKETFSKLKATESDLSRVEDLLFEIQKNLKSLERQAKRAKRYFELKEEYRRLSLELSYFRISEYKAAYKHLDKQIEEEKKKKKALDEDVARLEKRVERGRNGNLDKEKELAEAQKKLNNLVGKIKGKENDQKILTQKSLFLQQNNEKLDERIASNRKRIAETEQNIELQSDQLDEQYKLGKELTSQLSEAKEILETIRNKHGNVKKELEDFLIEQRSLNNAVFEQEKQAAVLQNQEESATKNIERLARVLDQRASEVSGITSQASQLARAQQEQEVTLVDLKKSEELRKKKLEETEQALDTAKENLSVKNRSLDAKRNEYKLLKSLVENMDGFSESIKFLSKNRSWSDNAPLLSDVFYCQPEYRAAVENYLEAYLSYYVVQNFTEALQAIDLLDEHKKGKANFFLMEQFPKEKKTQKKADKGIRALDVLEYDARYQALAEHLLGEVYIVAEKVGVEELDNERIWLTKDGKYTQRGYSIRGGSVGAFEGKKIGRKKNLELLETQIEGLRETAQILDDEVKDLRLTQQGLRQNNQQGEIQKLEKQLNETVRQAITIKSKLDSFEQFRKENEEQKIAYLEQIDQYKAAQKAVQIELTKVQKLLKQLKESVSEKDASAQAIADDMADASSNYNKKHIEQVRHQNGMASIEKELDFSHRQYKELKDQRKQDEAILNESGGDLTTTQKDIENGKVQLHEWYEVKRTYQETVGIAEKAYFEARGDMADTEKKLRDQQKQQTQGLELIGKLDHKFNEVKLQLTSIAERLNVEFEVKINDLVNESPNPEFEEAVLESNVERLRKQLANYGPINPMAIEAYDEIQGRNKLIIEQRDDLLESKENLLATIAEIEAKATERFMAAFNQARIYFVEVFRSLFHKDDTCDLKLTNPETPLESKIEIVAKPKGKRPLSINQLSGGEKTLTATALLFSLYLLKPAPFCIFDEVDAPLDDANIAKFNNIVKDFSKNSQFVIVTHNKKTMEAVDIMYGVTMVKGISRVVPVDFREMEMVT